MTGFHRILSSFQAPYELICSLAILDLELCSLYRCACDRPRSSIAYCAECGIVRSHVQHAWARPKLSVSTSGAVRQTGTREWQRHLQHVSQRAPSCLLWWVGTCSNTVFGPGVWLARSRSRCRLHCIFLSYRELAAWSFATCVLPLLAAVTGPMFHWSFCKLIACKQVYGLASTFLDCFGSGLARAAWRRMRCFRECPKHRHTGISFWHSFQACLSWQRLD